jgi:putative hydrolase of the HAD superfamily
METTLEPGYPARSHPAVRTARGYAAIVTDAAASGRVLIWDFDGTLGHRPARRSGAVADALTDVLGLHEFSQDMIAAEIHSGFPWHSPEVPHPQLADGDCWWQHLGEVLAAAISRLGVAPAAATAAASRVRPHYIDPASWQLFPDTVPTLAALSGLGWRHVLLSNHVPELPEIVTGLGLGRHLSVIVNSAATGYEKPHPEAFRLALERAGWPTSAWMIGDNLVADVAAAVCAGLRAILVRTVPADGSRHVPDLAQVIDLVTG